MIKLHSRPLDKSNGKSGSDGGKLKFSVVVEPSASMI